MGWSPTRYPRLAIGGKSGISRTGNPRDQCGRGSFGRQAAQRLLKVSDLDLRLAVSLRGTGRESAHCPSAIEHGIADGQVVHGALRQPVPQPGLTEFSRLGVPVHRRNLTDSLGKCRGHLPHGEVLTREDSWARNDVGGGTGRLHDLAG